MFKLSKKMNIRKGDVIYINGIPATISEVEPGKCLVTAETTGVKFIRYGDRTPVQSNKYQPSKRCRDCARRNQHDCERRESGTTDDAYICWKFVEWL
jgi:hypothetical protein